MRRLFILSLFLCVFAVTARSQSVSGFSGEWIADVNRSRLGDKTEELVSMSLRVTQKPDSIEWYKDGKVRWKSSPSEVSDRSRLETYALDGKPHENQLYSTLKVTNHGVVSGSKITITKDYERRNAYSNAVESRTRSFIHLELLDGGRTLKMSESDEGLPGPREELYFVRK